MKLALITLLLLTGSVRAASNYVACTWESVSNSIVNFTRGDTTVIAPGTIYWSNAVTFPVQSFGLWRGSGTNVTKFISVAGINQCINLPNVSNANTMVIGFFDADGVVANSSGFISIGVGYNTEHFTGQFQLTQIQMTNVIYRGMWIGSGDVFGVVDHCIFKAVPGAASFNSLSFLGNEYFSWTNSNPLGTTNQIVVEDCYMDTTAGVGNGHWDAYNGASYTIRNSIINNPANTGSHGYDSQVTSTRCREIYNNVWSNQNASTFITEDRGGTIVCFSNRVYGTGAIPTGFLLKYYRACNGSYQNSMGYSGYVYTNKFSGTATSGTATVLTDTTQDRGTLSPLHYPSEHVGRLLKLVSGTGSGQALTISANTSTTITVSGGTFSPAPDSTTGYEIWLQADNTIQLANEPAYTIKTTITGGNDYRRYVKLGATMQETLTNLFQCVNLDPAGAGLNYAQSTTNSPVGRQTDYRAVGILPNSLLLTNILDGYADYGWPAAQQFGVVQATKYTNLPVVLYPCYQWSNTCNGSNMSWSLAFQISPCNGFNYVTNLLKEGRDYVNDGIATNYTPLVYPHPLVTAFYGQSNNQSVQEQKLIINTLYLR